MRGLFSLIALLLAGPALAAAPQPAKPVGQAFFTGRWYEIARTPNDRQKDCQAPTYDFVAKKKGDPDFVLTCRKGSPAGKKDELSVAVKMPKGGNGSKFKVNALAGLISQEYWILDRADDLSWSILATPGGNYVWLLARTPSMNAAHQAELVAKLKALGYTKLEYPRHA